ncbi:MAG: cytochrome ubiquinol oxidase subunit I, partial [Prevotella sp.]
MPTQDFYLYFCEWSTLAFGWIFREMGRQPWVIVPNLSDPVSQVYMLTADGVSSVVSSGTVLA